MAGDPYELRVTKPASGEIDLMEGPIVEAPGDVSIKLVGEEELGWRVRIDAPRGGEVAWTLRFKKFQRRRIGSFCGGPDFFLAIAGKGGENQATSSTCTSQDSSKRSVLMIWTNSIRSFLMAAAVLFLSAHQSVIGATLALRYNFDEVPAVQTAFDTGLVLPPSNGQLTGGAVRSLNTPGTLSPFSIDFTTESPYAHVLGEDANKLDGLTQLTLTTWINVSQYTSGNHRLMSKQAGGAFGGFSWNMNATPNDGPVGPDNFRLGLFVGNNISSGAADFGSGFSTADVDAHNEWVFLAVSYDGTQAANNTKFYIGGVGGAVTQLGGDLTIVPLTVNAGTARFGVGFTDAAPTANTSVIGLQDDVRVYDGLLSLTELDAVRRSVVVPEPSTIALAIAGTLMSFCRRRRRSSSV